MPLATFPAALACGLLLTLGGCNAQPSSALADVSGHLPDLRVDISKNRPEPIPADDFRGRLVMLYFGYTSCPDQCPLTLIQLSRSMQLLGAAGNAIRTLFVTVDPDHDTPAVLGHYLMQFPDVHGIGISTDPANVAWLAKRYRAAYRPAESVGPSANMGGMSMSGAYMSKHAAADATLAMADATQSLPTHSAAVYVFDRAGHARRMITPGDSPQAIAADLRVLLAESTR